MPRLNGLEINSGFKRHESLVKRGIAGFIVFGGELEELRDGIARLQRLSKLPLIIASDLEQGLGQQVKGGTIFPPAMAQGRAGRELLKRAFKQMADEARYTGINTIFAPVLDINTNPLNPIIATRAFGETADVVIDAGLLMIKTFADCGIISCAKHFPGHGDTSIDSHISLPLLDKSLNDIRSCEIRPFVEAINARVPMIMMAHMAVPAIDPSGTPVSLSTKGVDYLRNQLGFGGMIITDAMNMGGIGKYNPTEAARMALEAGVDIILHPDGPEKLADGLNESGLMINNARLLNFRKRLPNAPYDKKPSFDKSLGDEISRKAIKTLGPGMRINNPFVVVLSDDEDVSFDGFVEGIKKEFPEIKHIMAKSGASVELEREDMDIIVAVFSSVKAWKGGSAEWLRETLKSLAVKSKLLVSFGNPYVFYGIGDNRPRILAYWPHESAQKAVADLICNSKRN